MLTSMPCSGRRSARRRTTEGGIHHRKTRPTPAMRNGPLLLVLAALKPAAAAQTAPPPEAPRAPRAVRLMLQWIPQSQFAGYYVASEKGIFREHGLEVEIISGGPDLDPIRHLEEGKADFV